jgi:hypothetical protein
MNMSWKQTRDTEEHIEHGCFACVFEHFVHFDGSFFWLVGRPFLFSPVVGELDNHSCFHYFNFGNNLMVWCPSLEKYIGNSGRILNECADQLATMVRGSYPNELAQEVVERVWPFERGGSGRGMKRREV